MSNISETVAKGWEDNTNLSGVTTVSLLVVALVSTIVGALTGMALHRVVDTVWLAIAAGLFGTVLAGLIRNTLLIRAWGAAGVVDAGTPVAIIIYAVVASLAGSLAAYQLMTGVGEAWPIVTGMLAGLLSAGLMGLLMVAYRMQPRNSGDGERW